MDSDRQSIENAPKKIKRCGTLPVGLADSLHGGSKMPSPKSWPILNGSFSFSFKPEDIYVYMIQTNIITWHVFSLYANEAASKSLVLQLGHVAHVQITTIKQKHEKGRQDSQKCYSTFGSEHRPDAWTKFVLVSLGGAHMFGDDEFRSMVTWRDFQAQQAPVFPRQEGILATGCQVCLSVAEVLNGNVCIISPIWSQRM